MTEIHSTVKSDKLQDTNSLLLILAAVDIVPINHHGLKVGKYIFLYFFIRSMDHDFLMTNMVMKSAFVQDKNDMETCSLQDSLHSYRKKEVE